MLLIFDSQTIGMTIDYHSSITNTPIKQVNQPLQIMKASPY